MSKKEDKGKIHSLEDLRENFEFFEHLQIDKSTFNKFVDRCGFNVGIIRDNFYDKSYEGCCSKIFCRCCKCCNRMLRKKMVKKMMEKEDEQLRLFVYDEREKRSKLQDIIAVVLAIVQAKSEVMHHVADFILCYTVYWTGMEAQNHHMWSYKFATVYIFMSISSVYLIAYSSMINMLLFKGVYEPQQIKRNSCCQVFFKLIFLSFLGPIYFVLVELVVKTMAVFASIAMLFCGQKGYLAVRVCFLRAIDFMFNLNEEQIDGLTKQRGVVQLLFESLPMVILQLLIRNDIVPCKQLTEESDQMLFISLIVCFVNMFVIMINIYTESQALTEPYLEYILNSFKARQGWIPFMIQIENKELKQAVDFGNVKCSYPLITGPTCIYKTFKFQFSDTSLQVLTSALVKWHSTTTEELATVVDLPDSDDDQDNEQATRDKKPQGGIGLIRNKYIMDVGGSLTYVSVNMLLHFYNLSPKERIHIKMSNMDWVELMSNSKKSNLIFKPKNSELMQARTPSGLHLLWICVEDEQRYNPTSQQLYDAGLGLHRRYVISKIIMDKLMGNDKDYCREYQELESFNDSRKDEGGAFFYIESQMENMLAVKNFTLMREISNGVEKATKYLDKVQLLVKSSEEYENSKLLSNIEEISEQVPQLITRLRDQTLEAEQTLELLGGFEEIELDETDKTQFEQTKAKIAHYLGKNQAPAKGDAKPTDEFDTPTIDAQIRRMEDMLIEPMQQLKEAGMICYRIKRAYDSIGKNWSSINAYINQLYAECSMAKNLIVICITKEVQKEKKEEQEQEEKIYEYEPDQEDEIDVKFAEIYKEYGNTLPVKKIDKKDGQSNWRYYDYAKTTIVCEKYNSYDYYMIHRPMGLDTQDYKEYFEKIQKGEAKLEATKRLKQKPLSKQIGAFLKFQVSETKINNVRKQLEELLNDLKQKEIIPLNYFLQKEFAFNLSEDNWDTYSDMLPPLDDMKVHHLDFVPDFTNPNAWTLKECFTMLLYDEKCDPNLRDNYGQTLMNMAIKNRKQNSIKILLQSNVVRINEASSRGVTPIGQAFISRNVSVIQDLLDCGADIHQPCVYDPRVSGSNMYPIQYFIKRIRTQGEDIKGRDKEILQLLVSNNIKCVKPEEKAAIHRQISRIHSCLKAKKLEQYRIIEEYMLPLISKEEINLLDFIDRKKSNFLHILIKSAVGHNNQRVDYFLEKGMYEYMPASMTKEEKKEQLKKLLIQKNGENVSPIQMAFESNQNAIIRTLCFLFIDKFSKEQEDLCLDYFYFLAEQNYESYLFRMEFTLSQVVQPLYEYFKDEDQMKKDLLEKAKNKPQRSVMVLPNLYNQLGIGEGDQGSASFGNEPRGGGATGGSADLQTIKISKAQPTGSKPGTYMRFVKEQSSGMLGSIQAMMQKSVHSQDSHAEIVKKLDKEKPPNPYFEFVFTLVLEVIAMFDMIGDIYLLIGMYQYGHTAWFTLSIFTMLSPFYVCYVPLVTFQKNRSKLQEDTCFLKFLNVLSLTPFIVAYLLLMDLIYIIVSVVITPITMLLKVLSCGYIDITNVEEKLDVLYEILFGMSDMDIKGFRRLRTISQLSFESLPQILLQVRILLYAIGGQNKLGVSMAAIVASLASAVLHAFFELIFVYLEAVSCKTTVIHYFIVCFNARFGWIPFVNFFSSLAGFDEESQSKKEDLNYEGMKSQICGIKFQMHFRFSNSSAAVLINSLSNLRDEKDPYKRMDLKIGESFNDVDFPLILDLIIISNNRINLDLSEVNMMEIIQNHEESMKDLTTKKEGDQSNQEYLIQRVAKLNQSSIVAVMLQIKDVYLDFKPTLLDIAIETNDYELAKLMFNQEGFQKELMKVESNECRAEKLILSGSPVILKAFFSNTNILVPEFYQMLIFVQIIKKLLVKQFDHALDTYKYVFGSSNPVYLLRGRGNQVSTRQVDLQKMRDDYDQVKGAIDEYVSTIPDKIYFYDDQSSAEKQSEEVEIHSIPTDIASNFAVLREKIIRHWSLEKDKKNELGQLDNPFNIKLLKVDMKSLLTVAKLLSDDHQTISLLTQDEVRECDKVVSRLHLDRLRSTYFYRSRQNDQTCSTYHIKIDQEAKLALDDHNQSRKPDFRERVVLVKERFKGATHCAFDYLVPEEVLAVKRFRIQFDFYGACMQMNILSGSHQSSYEISEHHGNLWDTKIYIEEFSEQKEEMHGFKDVIGSVRGGDRIQLWLQTDGYAFSKSVFFEMDVICKFGKEIALTGVKKEESDKKDEDAKKDEAAKKDDDSY